jgi:hypothetical protein
LTTFTNDIFLGRNQSFNSAQSISNSLIATNNVTGANISQINDCNIIVPRSSSLTFSYAGSVTGANFVSSGIINCASDPLYSTVISSGGSVSPGGTNLVVQSNGGGGAVTMNGNGNTYISSSSVAQIYNWPVGISDSTVIRSGGNPIVPTASAQLAVNHTTFLIPNLALGPAVSNATNVMAFNTATGRMAQYLSADLSRVLRRVGTTNASGQIVFSTGVITPLADSAINLTVRNASTTTSYSAQVIAIGIASFTVQVFNSVTVVLASPSMTPSGSGIIVHATMTY